MPTGVVFLLLGALALGGGVAIAARRRRGLRAKVEGAVDRHLDKLIALRAERLSYGGNGEIYSAAWEEEIERFMHSQLAESVTPAEARVLERRRNQVAGLIAARVARAAADPVWYRS